MTLGKKIIALFTILGTLFSIGIYATLQWSVFETFAEFERKSSNDALSRVTAVLDTELRAIAKMNNEYSGWDDTHEYARGIRPGYADKNLQTPYWRSIDIQLVLVFDVTGKLLHGHLTGSDDGSPLSLEHELPWLTEATHPMVTHESIKDSASGLVQARSGLMQVTSYPILTSEFEGPIAGSFVIGRFLNNERLVEMSRRATAGISVHPLNQEALPPRISSILEQLSDSGEGVLDEAADDVISQYQLLRDVSGVPLAVLEVDQAKEITQIGSDTVRTTLIFLIAASAIFLMSAWLFIERLIVAPVGQLTDKMKGIRETGNLSVEIGAKRTDEVGQLAGEFKRLASKLHLAQQASEMARQESDKARDEAVAMAKTKSEFLARMSHEIRTPMNGVLGMTELLQGTQLDGKQQRFAKTIYESAESLLSIINDILDFSKMEAGKLRLESIEVDLRNLLEETVDGLANLAYGKGLELNNSLPSNLTTLVETDPGRLRQVLTNLLGNAIKFTEQGEVTLKAGARHIDAQRVEILFEVVDSGIGIDPEKQQDIFDSFTQEDGSTTRLYGGTGLGLAISKQIVNLMGGDLNVESVPGEGSTFSFALVMNKGVETESRTSTQPQFVAGAKLLIVDDNATNREILEHQLEGWQACTDSAASATEALKVLEDAVSSGDPHDLAILDMHMPHTDGMDLARAIRENPNLSDLKLLILSSVATPASDQDLLDFRIAGQLTKPVRQSQLYDSLVVVLGGEMVAHTHSKGTVQSAKALTGHVLLAEDNLVNQVVAVGMLEKMGITVSVASNGREAVHEACSGAFAAILMDCQMPEMDGFQATREIRAAESESGKFPIPIVALTANALKGDREQCLAAGMSEYVAKPFTSEQLHSVLSLYLQPSNGIRQPDLSTPAEERTTTITLSETEPPIDSSVLEGISRYQKLGAPSIVDKIVTVYLETSRDATDKLRDAVKRTNATLLRECAHALKSSSANVGAMGLADLCKRLEVLAREGDLTTASKIHECLEREYERVVTALKRERAATAI